MYDITATSLDLCSILLLQSRRILTEVRDDQRTELVNESKKCISLMWSH